MFIELEERSPEWHDHRRRHIGGSEIAALFGLDPTADEDENDQGEKVGGFESIFSLYYIKGGVVPARTFENERMEAGIAFEPIIAGIIARRRGWKMRKGRYAIDDTTPGMAASLDYEIEDLGPDTHGVYVGGPVHRAFGEGFVPKGPGVLQIKQVDGRQFKKAWIGHEPPPYVLLQLQQEIACSGYTWGVVGAWVGGNSLSLYFYEQWPGVAAEIRKRITNFWRMVREQTPPQPDGSDASAYVLRELFPVMQDTSEAPVDLSGNNEVPGLCEELDRIVPERLRLEKRETAIKQRLSKILGSSTYGFANEWEVVCSVSRANPGRPPRPGELIGKRREARKISVKRRA